MRTAGYEGPGPRSGCKWTTSSDRAMTREIRMRSKAIVLVTLAAVAVLALGAAAAQATTYLDTGFGTPQGGSTARSIAMGSIGISLHTGSDALVLNPGAL